MFVKQAVYKVVENVRLEGAWQMHGLHGSLGVELRLYYGETSDFQHSEAAVLQPTTSPQSANNVSKTEGGQKAEEATIFAGV